MFGKAERKVTRPCDQFGHIGMEILTAFCDDAIERPRTQIHRQDGKDCTVPSPRTLECVNQPVEQTRKSQNELPDGFLIRKPPAEQ